MFLYVVFFIREGASVITTISTTSPLTSTPLVSPAQTSLPPGYGVLRLANAWYPCRLVGGQPTLMRTVDNEHDLWLSCAGYEQAQQCCFEDAELARYDEIVAIEHHLFTQTGCWPHWIGMAGHTIAASIIPGEGSASAEIVSYAPSLYGALLALTEEVERQRQEADLYAWEAWQQESVPTR